MIAGKETEGSVETCQRKEERKAERKGRKVDRGGKQSSWVQRTLSEAQASEARVSGLILQPVCRGLLACNHRRVASPRRSDLRQLPVRSGASISRLRLLAWWMLDVRFQDTGSSPIPNQKGMCCCSSKASGVEESKHRCPLAHTTRQHHHDPNNNLHNHKLAVKSRKLDKDQIKAVTWGSTAFRRLRGRVTRWGQRQRKSCKLNSSLLFKQRLHLSTLTSVVTNTYKSFYKKIEYSEAHNKENWRNVHDADPGTVEGIGQPVLWARGAEGGQQKGDKLPDTHGRQWWAVNGSNSESGDDPGHCTGHHANHSNTIHDSGTTKAVHNRSFDVCYRRKTLSKTNEGLLPNVSIDQSKSDDDAFFNFIKYRDKSSNRGSKTETIFSSSDDPAADLRTVLRARPNKSSERKRFSAARRTDAAHKRPGGEPNRSRRRQAKKVERSPSSRSSSSSTSESATRAKATGGLSLVSASRVKINKTPQAINEASLPVEDNCKDDTTEFLRKLDSVLTDLVESEKRKISSYGHPSVQRSKEEEVLLNRTSKKKSHKHKHRKVSKERERPHIEKEKKEESPALQQLRATLKTVRVRKRPTQPTADVLDTHSRCFTDKQPHNPRILRSQQGSQLLSYRCYQPPRRRKPRSQLHDNNYPSDFCSSDEEKRTTEGACQDIAQRQSLDDNGGDDPRHHATSSHKEDEDNICFGSDYRGSQGPLVRRPAASPSHSTQRITEAGDSGDHSVDSAYTGSRGATPESILYPSVKPRRTGSSLNTPFTGARPRPSRFPRCSPKAERLQQLKRNILNEIREGGLYSDDSINSLLEQYRRRYCHYSSTELALVTRSIQDDLGVKPRPAEYLYQILIASEDDHSPLGGGHSTTAPLTTHSTLLRKVSSPAKLDKFQLKQEDGQEQQPCSLAAPTPTHHGSEGASLSGQEEADEAWAKAVLGEVAPGLVQEAKEEARRRQDDGDTEGSAYVTDLCHQLQLKI